MDTLTERLDHLRRLIQDRNFLDGKGLSNEVNIRIFCYAPKDEMCIQHFVGQIVSDQTISSHVIECNLYKIFIEICADMDILDSIPDMEEADGSPYTLEQLHSAIGENEFIDKMLEKTELHGDDVLILTGVGEVFPFMRVHKMLEAMQPHFGNVPILVMYPGTFNGNSVRLFDILTPNPYYRAFNVL